MKSIDNYLKGSTPTSDCAVTIEHLRGNVVVLRQQGGSPSQEVIYLNTEQVKDLYDRLGKLLCDKK